MAVTINIIGDNDGSDEYRAAEKLKQIIEKSIPQTAMGEVILFPSATLYGQAVKDVDIIMIGELKNYSAKAKFNHHGENLEDTVYLESFCTTIEVKSHSISGIRREGTNIQVFYSNNGWHNATKQSNDQKTSAMNFFKNALGDSPYITNLIWLVEVSGEELDSLLYTGSNVMPSNVLPESFDFQMVLQKLALQMVPWRHNSRYVLECKFNGRDASAVTKPLLFFSKAKSGMGELTRKKIEQITYKELGENIPRFDGNTLNIFRGRAGTGKTIDLIKIAIKLVDEEGARVQILTYNRALVSDIRRLFSLAELPDMFEEKCVSVNTMQSYFFGVINGSLYDGKLSGEDFLRKYTELLKEMIDFLESDEDAPEIIKSICEDNPRLNWKYILIDEAQDWSEDERNLILHLYDKNNMIKAGNAAYDMLFIVPPTLVENESGHRQFTMKGEFERKGILLWDGTNDENRLDFSVDLSESRVVQYESSRGLEGWTVCCLNFDEYMQIKENQFDPDTEGNALFLQSAEETKKKYLLNWALLPMTRAIDTLIITLKDENSKYSKSLIELADRHPDYVNII